GLAQEIRSRGRRPREVLRAVAAGQQHLAGVRADAQHALAQLVAPRSEGLAVLADGVREVERLARFAEADLRMAQGRGVLLEEIDAGAARLTDAAGASQLLDAAGRAPAPPARAPPAGPAPG